MKYQTAELEGDALDYVVRCIVRGEQPMVSPEVFAAENDEGYCPSRNWDQGGPIFERLIASGFDIHPAYRRDPGEEGHFHCSNYDGDSIPYSGDWSAGYISEAGPTALIAAMRAYVASKLGDEVDLPD